jgi:hypothetical protein
MFDNKTSYITCDNIEIFISSETAAAIEGRSSSQYLELVDKRLFDMLVLVLEGWSSEVAMRKAGFHDYVASRGKIRHRPLYLEARAILEERNRYKRSSCPRKNYARIKRLKVMEEKKAR